FEVFIDDAYDHGPIVVRNVRTTKAHVHSHEHVPMTQGRVEGASSSIHQATSHREREKAVKRDVVAQNSNRCAPRSHIDVLIDALDADNARRGILSREEPVPSKEHASTASTEFKFTAEEKIWGELLWEDDPTSEKSVDDETLQNTLKTDHQTLPQPMKTNHNGVVTREVFHTHPDDPSLVQSELTFPHPSCQGWYERFDELPELNATASKTDSTPPRTFCHFWPQLQDATIPKKRHSLPWKPVPDCGRALCLYTAINKFCRLNGVSQFGVSDAGLTQSTLQLMLDEVNTVSNKVRKVDAIRSIIRNSRADRYKPLFNLATEAANIRAKRRKGEMAMEVKPLHVILLSRFSTGPASSVATQTQAPARRKHKAAVKDSEDKETD
ncbi:hypothetical protein BU25DRAFT_482614, partial [Macroventuria anomochaeta]